MPKIRKPKGGGDAPQGFPNKLWEKLSQPWRDAAMSAKTEDLEQSIIKAVRNISQTSQDMKADTKLTAIMEQLKDLKGAYTETLAVEKAKIEFIIFLFNSRGMKVKAPKLPDEEED